MNPERKLAKEKGEPRFFTGKPCANGHISERFTCSANCVECQRVRRFKFREVHPRQLAKERGDQFYFTGLPCKNGHIVKRSTLRVRCVVCAREWRRKYLNSHPEKRIERWLKRKTNNPKTLKAKKRRWQLKNREKLNEKSKKYYAEGPQNPQTELQWIKKAQAINRMVNRQLKSSEPDLTHLQQLVQNLSQR